MSLQNKILLVTMFALGTILWGCNALVYDNMEDCPQGVYVKFYSRTPCGADSSFIGEVRGLHLFAFDAKDVLAAVQRIEKATLSKDFEVLMPVSNGYYTFIGWAGVNNKFTIADFKTGVTTQKDVMLTLKAENNRAPVLGSHKVWQGKSPVVQLEPPARVGSQYKRTAVNLTEVTNRINVEVELHTSILKDAFPQDFIVEVSSANGVMNINGGMPFKGEVLNYPAIVSHTTGSLKAAFSLMDLKAGYNSLIKITNKKKNEVIWKGDLIGSILLKNNNINLDCQHDFDVKFVIKDKCLDCGTYICWAIFVNNWQIHSYETQLGYNN